MKMLIRKLSISTLICTIVFLSSFSQVVAEDIEIYNRTQTIPNVLFVIDTSGSMNDPVDPLNPGGDTRLKTVKDAFETVLSDTYSLLNVGIMDFRSWTGSGVDFPVADVNQLAKSVEPGVADTNETYAELLTRSVKAYTAGGSTPTVEALYEAALYFRGEEPFEGNLGAPNYPAHVSWNDGNSRYTGGHWTAMGRQTYENATMTYQDGQWCLNESVSFANARHGLCGSKTINPSTCEDYDNPVCNGGNYVCSGPTNSDGGCLGASICSGTEVLEKHNRCRLSQLFISDENYRTPIQTACTSNHIVLLSDGKPTEDDNNTKARIRTLTGKTNCDSLATKSILNSGIVSNGECGTDLVEFLHTVDQSSGLVGTNQPDNQFIKTHTIGFQLDAGSDGLKFLDEIAKAGGTEKSIDAADPSALVSALKSIVSSITAEPRVISRVGSSLDLSNLGSSRSEVYMPLFSYIPNQPRWPGNLKGYNVNALGVLEGIGTPPEPTFLEIDTSSPLDGIPDTSVFNSAVQSFWSSTADGAKLNEGGVAPLISPTLRTLKTENGTGGLMDLDTGVTALNTDPALFGLPGATPAEIDQLIGWANGFDSFDEDGDSNVTETRTSLVGDALHSDPVVANYSGLIKNVVYFMTNDGVLHAINATDNTSASELFAFMPRDLLDNLDPLQNNVGGAGKIYGLDGPLVLFQAGGPTNVTGEKYLFFGMRRGGMNYYALNVTDPTNPTLMWTIKGGSGDFAEMGQSWSTPIVTNVDNGGTDTLALVIGGGYDTDQDSTNIYTTDDQGRAVYIVDAVNDSNNDGQADLLWSAGPAATPQVHDLELPMTNSVAGDVSIIDFDNDTIADRLYFGDIGGQVWRIDLEGDITDASQYSGYMLANLSGATTADNRRFFSRPVAALTSSGRLAITIGSGNRAHPLETGVTNRFYTIFDANPTNVPSTAPSAIDDSDLQDLSGFSNGFDYSNSSTVSGWRIDLSTNEKVFAEAAVLRGELFFTTYVPPSNVCSDIPDGANLYILNLDGEPSRDLSATPDGTNDAFMSVLTYGLLPPMVPHYGADGRVTGLFGPNSLELYKAGALEDKFWTNKP